MKRTALFFLVLFLVCVFSQAYAATKTVWDTNWNVMTLWRDGNSVSGEYIYDDGVISGTMDGNIFRGYWREANNAKECGPNNEWSGPVVLRFADNGKSFTGSWGYCSTDINSLNPDGTGWTGTLKEGATGYTQTECEAAGRYWCDGDCQINPCGTTLTQTECEAAGKFWCNGQCQITSCSATPANCNIKIDGLTVTGTRSVNQDVIFTVGASTACNDTLYYRFSVHPDYGSSGYDGMHWSSMTSTEYVSSNSLTYKFTQSGNYIVVVWVVKDTSNVNPNGVPILGWSVQID